MSHFFLSWKRFDTTPWNWHLMIENMETIKGTQKWLYFIILDPYTNPKIAIEKESRSSRILVRSIHTLYFSHRQHTLSLFVFYLSLFLSLSLSLPPIFCTYGFNFNFISPHYMYIFYIIFSFPIIYILLARGHDIHKLFCLSNFSGN